MSREQTITRAMKLASNHARARRAAGGALHLAHGGSPGQESYPAQFGLVASAVPGRTDRHNMDLPSGSYVLPADVVAGLGEGNTLAGSAVVDKMFHSMPYGIQPIQPGKGVMPRRDFTAGRPAPVLPDRSPSTRGAADNASFPDDVSFQGMATGGSPDDNIPVVVAGGEHIIDPETIAHHPRLGNLDPANTDPEARKRALTRGHDILDSFVKARRAKDIKTLKSLPPPKR